MCYRKWAMVVAIVLGAVAGFVGFLPLFAGLRLTKQVTETSNLGHMGALLLSVFASFIILFASTIGCIFIARDLLLPFALAEVAALSVTAICFGVTRLIRK